MSGPIRSSLLRLRNYHVRVREGFAEFQRYETSGAFVLLAATVLALVLANSPLREAYAEFWHTHLAIEFGGWALDQSLLHWIDDGLMALFFFVVGLEIKRQVVVGELRTLRKATLPILAAIGGMVVPALIYFAFNAGGEGASGWGIPMATDIAFALGVLALLGDRVPAGLRIFLTALAIADDLGAILVIAFVYTASIAWSWLGFAAVALVVLMVLNYLRVESPLPYWLIGAFVWFCFLNSGVHATIAGVLVAFTIPSASRVEPMTFVERARAGLKRITELDVPGEHVLNTDDQQHYAQELREEARWMQAPLQRMEHAMLPVSNFVILPLFALANAGVTIVGNDFVDLIFEPVSLGVILGLVFGKQLGITAFTWLAVKLKLADLPSGVTWRHVYGVAWLGGIGFTMSLFIAGLAFRTGLLQTEAKLAILVASVIAGVGGWLVLKGAKKPAGAASEDSALAG